MSEWVARYEEGYITADGASITLVDEIHHDHLWESPEDAVHQWAARVDLQGSGVQRVGNGLQQTDDVRERPEFDRFGVVSIWRRVTFERTAVPASTKQMSEADGTDDLGVHTTEGGAR
nr:hypothetical protein BJQ95_00905 [Cryobacterium sp. SO1]